MLSDIVRASIRLARKELLEILVDVPEDRIFTPFQIADIETCFICDEIMNSGVHFDLGSQNELDDLSLNSIPDPDMLVRQLNIMGVKLPYKRMSLNMSCDYKNKVESMVKDLKKKVKESSVSLSEDQIRYFLNRNGTSDMHFSFLVESLTDDLILTITWYTKDNPEELLSWGHEPRCSIISLYNNFKDREIPPPEFFEEKGVSFINFYRDQIIDKDACIINIPINSRETMINNEKDNGNYDQFTEKMMDAGEEKDISFAQLELFRFLFLMNTKGVQVKNVDPGVKKNKKRKKENKFPLLAYKILEVDSDQIGRSYEHTGDGESKWSNRKHTCRGHIKIYTIDKPLFGHTDGPVWVRPHLRGLNSNKEIKKDYKIKLGK